MNGDMDGQLNDSNSNSTFKVSYSSKTSSHVGTRLANGVGSFYIV